MTAETTALAMLGTAVLFLAGVLLLFGCLWMAARSLAEVQRFRSHRLTTTAQEDTLRASEDALEELDNHPSRHPAYGGESGLPSDEELLAYARAQSGAPAYGGEEPPMEAYQTTDDNAIRASRNGEAGDIEPDHLYHRQMP